MRAWRLRSRRSRRSRQATVEWSRTRTGAQMVDSRKSRTRFQWRLVAAGAFVVLCFMLLVARLVYLQVVRHEELAAQAESNRTTVVPIVPQRGLIKDRNGVVLASNYAAYTLEITPARIGDLEATLDALAEIVEITPRDRRRFKRLLEDSKRFESLPLRNRLSDEEVARITAQRYRLPGVDVQARMFREYPQGELGSHVIGYIGRINAREKEDMTDWPDEDQANYRGTDVIGKLGLEQAYERELHGQTGYHQLETSAGGRAVRRLSHQTPTPGQTLYLSIDIKLQALVESLFKHRRGALVAIDPRNGEVLAFVSKPTFDPNLFVDGIDQDSWRELSDSIDKPLLNRALRGTYPPGSTYKPFMSIAALNSGKRSAHTIIQDNLTFTFGGRTFGSPESDRPGPKDMRAAIVSSSNVYYYTLANEMGVDLIHDQLAPFGFGRRTGIDLRGEVPGLLPSTDWKRGAYKKPEQQRWYAGETISLGIGQGYNSFTMLQLASAMATLASGGQRHQPRIVREIEDPVSRTRRPPDREALAPLALKPADVAVIRDAMYGVTQSGTSRAAFAGAPYKSGGKTGTAQAVSLRAGQRYNAAAMEEHKRDHSLYVAFAPLDAPTVALAVIVENAGFGSTSAAPIARRVLDYLLLGQYPNEADIALTQAGRSTAPVGAPIPAASAPLPASQAAPALGAVAPRPAVPRPSPVSAPAAAPPPAAAMSAPLPATTASSTEGAP